jgi:hypothetical protein
MASVPVAHSGRDLLDHGAGKGDKERSSRWREGYNDINWPGVTGLVREGSKLVKRYHPDENAFSGAIQLQLWNELATLCEP